jgi:hypothetical protein
MGRIVGLPVLQSITQAKMERVMGLLCEAKRVEVRILKLD